MISNRLYPWGQFLTTLLFCFVFELLYHAIREVPNIVLVVNSWMVFVRGTADGHMTVYCNPTNGDIFTFQHFYAAGKASFSIALDDVTSET